MSAWQKLRPFLDRRHRLMVLWLAVLGLVGGLLEAVLLVLVVTSALAIADGDDAADLDLPLAGSWEGDPGTALTAALVAGVVVLFVHTLTARLGAALAAWVLASARRRAMRAFAGATWSQQAREREGSLQETASSLSTQSAQVAVHLSTFIGAVLGLVALLGTAFVVDPIATLMVLGLGGALVAALQPVRLATLRWANRFVASNSRFTERTTQWGSIAMELRAFGVDAAEADRLIAESDATADAFARSRFAAQAGVWLLRDLAVLFLVAAVAVLYLIGDVDLAAVGSVVILIVRSLSFAQMSQASLQSMTEHAPSLDALVSRIELLEAEAAHFGHLDVDELGPIVLDGVGYDYEPGLVALDDVNLTVAPGESVGVIGPSGGGKSTLVQVLLRLRPPSRGMVTVGGVDYLEIEPASWSRLVALVPQEPRLFEGTVADNIAFQRPGITGEQVERAAIDAQVIDDIRALPLGFDTQLGPRGAGLSGGQKQRIAIARALVGDPQLLVLDEPTSALDVRSEQLLQQTITSLSGRVTLVIVAHRISTLSVCDRVLALADGRVVAEGTLEEALSRVHFDEVASGPVEQSSPNEQRSV